MTAFAEPTTNTDPIPLEFSCEVAPHRDVVHVIPQGELDIATTPIVAERLVELRDAGFTSIVLDLRRLRFLDSSGLALVLRWSERAAGADHRFQVIPGNEAVQRVFALTRTTALVNFADMGRAAAGSS